MHAELSNEHSQMTNWKVLLRRVHVHAHAGLINRGDSECYSALSSAIANWATRLLCASKHQPGTRKATSADSHYITPDYGRTCSHYKLLSETIIYTCMSH